MGAREVMALVAGALLAGALFAAPAAAAAAHDRPVVEAGWCSDSQLPGPGPCT